MYRHFLLNSGYAEEQSLASVFLSKLDGTFSTVKEAVETLVNGLAAEFKFDTSDSDAVYAAIYEFLNGSMQTHGYFLFSQEWNTGNMTDDIDPGELVVCIDRAPQVISEIFDGTIDKDYFKCMVSCIKINAVRDLHEPRLF